MIGKTSLIDLKLRLRPYLEFWEEWSEDEACFLKKEEIALINKRLQQNFREPLFLRWIATSESLLEKKIHQRLKDNYQLFQEWVIFRFLCGLIRLAGNYEDGRFLDEPIRELRISEELKSNLVSFKTNTVRQLFYTYAIEDFHRSWVYENILEFHRISR